MLTLLLCPDSSAGTDEILKRIAQDVESQRPNRILIVPEMISHDIERRLCEVCGDTASRFAQVLTFSRLASRMEELTGTGALECMDAGGRIVAMASAVRNLHSRLKAYSAVGTKPEFLSDLVTAVDEFKRCCVSVENLRQAKQALGIDEGLFSQKLEELILLFDGYEAVCRQGKRDPRDLIDWVLDRLNECDFAQTHEIYVDGFPDFSIQHMQILEHLIDFSNHVTVCLHCDSLNSRSMAFEKARQTAIALYRMADKSGIKPQVIELPGRPGALRTVREYLFQGPIQPIPDADRILHLYRADSVYQECQVAAQTIRELALAGKRYRDIVLVCTDLAAYRAPLRLVFQRWGIPLYLAGTEDILQSGVLSTVISALDAVLDGMEQRDVLRYLRSALSPIDLNECDTIENYALVWGISGKRWQETWTQHPDGLSGRWDDQTVRQLDKINEIRSRLVTPLERLRSGLQNASLLSGKITALYDFLEETAFAQRLQTLSAEMEQAGDHRSAQICGQLWEILLSALEQLYDVLGNTDWDNENFSRLLRLLLSQYNVGTIPPVLDGVTAGDVGAMRCQRGKHLILLGVNEGQLPSYAGASGVLTEQERAKLRTLRIPLSGGNLEGLQSQFAEIMGLFCGPEETITVTCSDEPSFIYRRLNEMAGGTVREAAAYLTGVENAVDAAAILVAAGEDAAARRLGIHALYEHIYCGKEYSLGSIQPENIAKLYGKRLNLSASQVDRQAECRLSYFLQYGLRAKERKEAKVDPAEFGTYVHSVLEKTAKEVMERGGFRAVDLQETLCIADRHSKAYAQEHFGALDSQRMEYLFRRNMQELELVVQELWRELHEAAYTPERFELSFARDGEMPPVRITDADMDAELRGFVDRVDLWHQGNISYVRVVDYKTGKKDFDYCDVFNGVGLQMLLYLFALEEGGQEITGPVSVPAGVQYFPARAPYILAESAHDADAWKKRQKQWVRKGLLLKDEASLTAMDPSDMMESLNCKRSKDGELSGDLADRGQMLQLKQYVMAVLRRMVNDIASGNVQPNPYTRGTSHDACTFCPYGAVCHKQSVDGRRNYKTMTSQRFWEEIGKELNQNG